MATVHAEEDAALARGGKDPFIVVKAPSASKGGVAETSIKVSFLVLKNMSLKSWMKMIWLKSCYNNKRHYKYPWNKLLIRFKNLSQKIL